MRQGIRSDLLPLGVVTKTLCASSVMHNTRPVNLGFIYLMIIIIFDGESNHDLPQCVAISNFYRTSKLSSSAPCSQIPSVYVFPLMCETKSFIVVISFYFCHLWWQYFAPPPPRLWGQYPFIFTVYICSIL